MKRLYRLLIVVCMVGLLFACAAQSVTTIDGIALEFLDDGRTIRYGEQTYIYSTDSKTITIEYPNGYLYTYTSLDQSQYSGQWSYQLDAPGFLSGSELGYIDEDVLVTELQNHAKKGRAPAMLIPALLLASVGLGLAVKPKNLWYVTEGWKFKNAEPSDAALGLYRFMGIALIVFGAIILFM